MTFDSAYFPATFEHSSEHGGIEHWYQEYTLALIAHDRRQTCIRLCSITKVLHKLQHSGFHAHLDVR